PSDAPQTGVTVKTRLKTQRPAMYKVLLLNDDFTPMEFVVDILMGIFGKSEPEATDVMLHVHRKGVGLCGVFSFEVAETKMTQVLQAAKVAQHPLKCVMEKE
ncbi:MAG: ATP-dependent Clp protease adapter ClpS, partial [Alphaproteobacteria bacterium]|nr:ATP-dependent Clp protease adapter ClpS [Alphaproteobacteria bacterium]